MNNASARMAQDPHDPVNDGYLGLEPLALAGRPLHPDRLPTKPSPAMVPTPVPVQPALTVDPQHGAAILRDGVFAVYLSSAVDKELASQLPITSFQLYRDELLNDLDGTADRISAMMCEQLCAAHHILLRLQVRLGHAASPAECQLLAGAASQLMGEFRRTAEAFRGYQKRAPAANTKSATVASADPVRPAPGAERPNEKNESSSKLGSNHGTCNVGPEIVPFEEPATRRRRKAKSA